MIDLKIHFRHVEWRPLPQILLRLPSSVRDSGIIHLFFSCGPLAVVRRIWTVVVFALDGHSIRSRAHVLEECLKAFHPSLADSDAPTAVILKVLVFSVGASLSHSVPYVVKRFVVECHRPFCFCYSLCPVASTARCISTPNCFAGKFDEGTTVAFEQPYDVPIIGSFFGRSDRNKPSELFGHGCKNILGVPIPKIAKAFRALLGLMWFTSLPLVATHSTFGRYHNE